MIIFTIIKIETILRINDTPNPTNHMCSNLNPVCGWGGEGSKTNEGGLDEDNLLQKLQV